MQLMKVEVTSVLTVFFFSFFSICHTNNSEFNHCYANTSNPYLLMGTRTAYEFSHGNISQLSSDYKCKPVKIWALIRHGTRYPGQSEINLFSSLFLLRDQIISNHENRKRGSLCKNDLENLRKWNLDFSKMTPNILTSKGKKELRSFAKRLRTTFPELLQIDPQNVSQNDYIFRATDTQRTQASMKAFMDELFNGTDYIRPVKPPKNDSLLFTYKNCPVYEEGLESDEVVGETKKFTAGTEFQNMLTNVSKRLGFDHNIKNDKLLMMYEICRFEKAWETNFVSAWCAAFTDNDIRILEYREDMGCYYYCGPGRKINEMLGCPLVKDMMNHLRDLKNQGTKKSKPKGIFYFSHTVTIQAMMAAMGIGKDSPAPLATNYHLQNSRNFRTSFIGPFAGNLIAVLYSCNNTKSHKVMFHVSEKLWTLDGCTDGICEWKSMKKLDKIADQCNLNFCYQSN